MGFNLLLMIVDCHLKTHKGAFMYFTEAIKICFQKYFTFSGRASRAEFWLFTMFQVISVYIVMYTIPVLLLVSGMKLHQVEDLALGILFIPLSILSFPLLSVFIRRLHDYNKSGYWWWLNLVPLIGQIILLNWLMKPSDPNENKYGPVPEK